MSFADMDFSGGACILCGKRGRLAGKFPDKSAIQNGGTLKFFYLCGDHTEKDRTETEVLLKLQEVADLGSQK